MSFLLTPRLFHVHVTDCDRVQRTNGALISSNFMFVGYCYLLLVQTRLLQISIIVRRFERRAKMTHVMDSFEMLRGWYFLLF